MKSITSEMSGRIWLMLISLSVLWGGSYFFVGVLVTQIEPLMIVTLRVGIAAIILWGIVLISGGQVPKNLSLWTAFFGMGILNNIVPFLLIVWGQTKIAAGLASIFNASTPLFTVMLAYFLLSDERPTQTKIIGVIIGFLGVILVIGLPDLTSETSILPQLAVLSAALSYAVAGIFGRRFKEFGINSIVTAAGQVTASTTLLLLVNLTVGGFTSLSHLSTQSWLSILGLSIFSTAIAYVLYFKILESAGATNLLLVTLLIPVSAIVLGYIFLDENLSVTTFAGMVIIALGLITIDGRALSWLSTKIRED